MRPSIALTMIESLGVAVCAAERRFDELRSTRLDILARLDAGENLATLGQIAADAIGAAVSDATFAESDEPAPTRPDDAPYGRHPDGTPKKKPGRTANEAPSREDERAGKIVPIDATGVGVAPLSPDERRSAALIDAAAKAPVDEAKNAAELRSIRSALEGGPLTIGELVMNSGVSRPDVMRHLAAGAVIEEYTGARGEKLDPLPLVRLISQRPS